jgi:3-hydroxybutyryl-CoA dehydrogenase
VGIDKLLEKDVAKQRISKEGADATKARISSTTDMDSLSEVDFAIEAVPVRLQFNYQTL